MHSTGSSMMQQLLQSKDTLLGTASQPKTQKGGNRGTLFLEPKTKALLCQVHVILYGVTYIPKYHLHKTNKIALINTS